MTLDRFVPPPEEVRLMKEIREAIMVKRTSENRPRSCWLRLDFPTTRPGAARITHQYYCNWEKWKELYPRAYQLLLKRGFQESDDVQSLIPL